MNFIKLNPNFSTTRMVVRDNCLTINSVVEGDKLKETGGLRTKGYRKLSFSAGERSQSNSIEQPSGFLPLVTIITVVYNNDIYLEETINSVISQSYDNIEYIIVDGGSTDKTLEIIRQYEDTIDLWISESDRGLYDAMNKGIALATGEIIGILNSDDLYLENAVLEVVEKYREIQQPCVIYGDMYKFADEYQTVSLQKGDLSDRAFETASIIINHPTCFVQRSLYENFGTFQPEYEVGADRELMMRFHAQNVPFIDLDRTLAKFRLGGTTSNQSLSSIINREIIQEYVLLNTYKIARTRIARVLLKKTVQSLRKWLFYQLLGEKLTNQIIMSYIGRKFPKTPQANG